MILPWIYFIQEDEQLLIESFTRRKIINGPGRYVAQPFEKVTRREGLRLSPTQYLHLTDTLSGNLRNIQGPTLYFLSASEEVVTIEEALPCKRINTPSSSIRKPVKRAAFAGHNCISRTRTNK